MPSGLETGFLLDRQWHWMRSGMEQTKEPALLALDIDLADAQSLLEATPELAGEMTPEEKAALDRLRL